MKYVIAVLLIASSLPLNGAEVPQSVEQLWADFDPRKDALETEVIREFKEDGGVFRHVRFVVGTFKGKTAGMTAIYGFPDATTVKSSNAGTNEKLPAVMHIHGGGQRAFLSEVKLLVSRGYAGLSVNWGGSAGQRPINSVEGAMPGDPNTDWGAVDPSQLNATRYDSILPGPDRAGHEAQFQGEFSSIVDSPTAAGGNFPDRQWESSRFANRRQPPTRQVLRSKRNWATAAIRSKTSNCLQI